MSPHRSQVGYKSLILCFQPFETASHFFSCFTTQHQLFLCRRQLALSQLECLGNFGRLGLLEIVSIFQYERFLTAFLNLRREDLQFCGGFCEIALKLGNLFLHETIVPFQLAQFPRNFLRVAGLIVQSPLCNIQLRTDPVHFAVALTQCQLPSREGFGSNRVVTPAPK